MTVFLRQKIGTSGVLHSFVPLTITNTRFIMLPSLKTAPFSLNKRPISLQNVAFLLKKRAKLLNFVAFFNSFGSKLNENEPNLNVFASFSLNFALFLTNFEPKLRKKRAEIPKNTPKLGRNKPFLPKKTPKLGKKRPILRKNEAIFRNSGTILGEPLEKTP